MSNLTTARDTALPTLTGVTDAGYPGDPLATDIKEAYCEANVHNYIKDLAKAVLPARTYHVRPTHGTDLGNPYFLSIALAHAQVKTDTSSSSNKALIEVGAKADSYSDALTLNDSGYIAIVGKNKHNCVISGNIAVSAGTYIFANLTISGTVTVSGGKAIFINCTGSGATGQTGTSTLMIWNCENWGVITLSGNSNILWVEYVANIEKDGSSQSIILGAGMTSGQYVFRYSQLEGTLEEDTAATETIGITQNATARPSY